MWIIKKQLKSFVSKSSSTLNSTSYVMSSSARFSGKVIINNHWTRINLKLYFLLALICYFFTKEINYSPQALVAHQIIQWLLDQSGCWSSPKVTSSDKRNQVCWFLWKSVKMESTVFRLTSLDNFWDSYFWYWFYRNLL